MSWLLGFVEGCADLDKLTNHGKGMLWVLLKESVGRPVYCKRNTDPIQLQHKKSPTVLRHLDPASRDPKSGFGWNGLCGLEFQGVGSWGQG